MTCLRIILLLVELILSLKNRTILLLQNYGQVFCAFDEQDFGNISFGVDNGIEKRFIKYAGAKTVAYKGDISSAIERLKKAMSVYKALKHPSLVELIKHFETTDGYVAIFKWVDGECLYAHWNFEKYPKYTHPRSPTYRYRNLPLEKRLDSLDVIFEFHQFVADNGYVAIDFYDGSVIYNFETDTTIICDIDHYEKEPFQNNMGRMWGSSRFMSPEEYEFGAVIDQVTNVFNMGAFTFEVLGNSRDHSFENWNAGKALYEVAMKATCPNRGQRYQSIAEFRDQWKRARCE